MGSNGECGPPPPSLVHVLAGVASEIFPGPTSTWYIGEVTADLYSNNSGARLLHCSLSGSSTAYFGGHLWTIGVTSSSVTQTSVQVNQYGPTSCTPISTTSFALPGQSASIDAFVVDNNTLWVASSDGFNESLFGFDKSSGVQTQSIGLDSTSSDGQHGQLLEVGSNLWFAPSEGCTIEEVSLVSYSLNSTINLNRFDGGTCTSTFTSATPFTTDGTTLWATQGKRLLALNGDGTVAAIIANVNPASVTFDNGTVWIASVPVKSGDGTCAPLKKVVLTARSSVVSVGCIDTTSLEPTVCVNNCYSPPVIAAHAGQLWVNTGIEFPLNLAPSSAPRDVRVRVSRFGIATVSWRAPAVNPSSVTNYHVLINGKDGLFGPIATTRTMATVNLAYLFNVGRSITLAVFPYTPLGSGAASLSVATPVGDPSALSISPPKSVSVGAHFLAVGTVYWNVQHGGPGTPPTPQGTVTFSANGHSCTASIAVSKSSQKVGPYKFFNTVSTASCSLPAPSSHGTFVLHGVYNGGPAEFSPQKFFYPSAPASASFKA